MANRSHIFLSVFVLDKCFSALQSMGCLLSCSASALHGSCPCKMPQIHTKTAASSPHPVPPSSRCCAHNCLTSASLTSSWVCVLLASRYERLVGFYKGLLPCLARVVPACCITFLTFEKLTQFFQSRRKQDS